MAKANQAKQFEAALAPVVAFIKLVMKNAESVFDMQVASVKAYAELGLHNINAGLDVASVEDFKAYAEKQKDVAQEVTARMTADAKALAELNTKFIEDARDLAEENMKSATETAKTVVEAAKAA